MTFPLKQTFMKLIIIFFSGNQVHFPFPQTTGLNQGVYEIVNKVKDWEFKLDWDTQKL